jgi:hypothetical protein
MVMQVTASIKRNGPPACIGEFELSSGEVSETVNTPMPMSMGVDAVTAKQARGKLV